VIDDRTSSVTAIVALFQRLVIRLKSLVGKRWVAQRLCSLDTTAGRDEAGIERAASRATEPGSGEWT
jgi:hypothetical protein